jgi:hypothetical protein
MNPAASDIASWNHFEDALSKLCDAWNSEHFVPLLEADVAGYLYHVFLEQFAGDARRWHLDTRLKGAKANDKFDLVYGPVLSAAQQRDEILRLSHSQFSETDRKVISSNRFLAKLRPVVVGSFVVEIKLFATGFDLPQQNVHFGHALGDIARLETLANVCPDGRAVLLVDAESYLKPERRKRIVETRSDPRLRIYLCGRLWKREITWERL